MARQIPGTIFKSTVLVNEEYIFHRNKYVHRTGVVYHRFRNEECGATGIKMAMSNEISRRKKIKCLIQDVRINRATESLERGIFSVMDFLHIVKRFSYNSQRLHSACPFTVGLLVGALGRPHRPKESTQIRLKIFTLD
jgi:hypothetical protein